MFPNPEALGNTPQNAPIEQEPGLEPVNTEEFYEQVSEEAEAWHEQIYERTAGSVAHALFTAGRLPADFQVPVKWGYQSIQYLLSRAFTDTNHDKQDQDAIKDLSCYTYFILFARLSLPFLPLKDTSPHEVLDKISQLDKDNTVSSWIRLYANGLDAFDSEQIADNQLTKRIYNTPEAISFVRNLSYLLGSPIKLSSLISSNLHYLCLESRQKQAEVIYFLRLLIQTTGVRRLSQLRYSLNDFLQDYYLRKTCLDKRFPSAVKAWIEATGKKFEGSNPNDLQTTISSLNHVLLDIGFARLQNVLSDNAAIVPIQSVLQIKTETADLTEPRKDEERSFVLLILKAAKRPKEFRSLITFIGEFSPDFSPLKSLTAPIGAARFNIYPMLENKEFISFLRRVKLTYGWTFSIDDEPSLSVLYRSTTLQQSIFSPQMLKNKEKLHVESKGGVGLSWLIHFAETENVYGPEKTARAIDEYTYVRDVFNFSGYGDRSEIKFFYSNFDLLDEQRRAGFFSPQAKKLFRTLTESGFIFKVSDINKLANLLPHAIELNPLIKLLHQHFSYTFSIHEVPELVGLAAENPNETSLLKVKSTFESLERGAVEYEHNLITTLKLLINPVRLQAVVDLKAYGYTFHPNDDEFVELAADPQRLASIVKVLAKLKEKHANIKFVPDYGKLYAKLAPFLPELNRAVPELFEEWGASHDQDALYVEIFCATNGNVTEAKTIHRAIAGRLKRLPNVTYASSADPHDPSLDHYIQNLEGTPPIDADQRDELVQDGNIFFESILLPGRDLLLRREKMELMGEDLRDELVEFHSGLVKVIKNMEDPMTLVQFITKNSAAVMLHATRYDRTNATVQSIVRKFGIRIMGKELNVGAYMLPEPPVYTDPDPEIGNTALILSEDLHQSHVGIAEDPAQDEGYVAMDSATDTLVRVIPRCTLNPGPSQVLVKDTDGNEYHEDLGGKQTLAFLILERWILKDSGFCQRLHARCAKVQKELGENYFRNLAQLYKNARSRGYSEATTVDMRDYYTLYKLKERLHPRHSFAGPETRELRLIERAFAYVEEQGDEKLDLVIFMDTLREHWESGLGGFLNNESKLSIPEVELQMQRYIKKLQRVQFLEAMKNARTTAQRQEWITHHESQVSTALISNAVPPLALPEFLQRTRDIFFGDTTTDNTDERLRRIEKTGREIADIKWNVLKEAWDTATAGRNTDGIYCCLAGSAARGEATPFSDIDLMVVVDSSADRDTSKYDRALELHQDVVQTLQSKFNVKVDSSGVLDSKDYEFYDEYAWRKVLDADPVNDPFEAEGLLSNLRKNILRHHRSWITDDSSVKHFGMQWHKAIAQFISGDAMRDFKHEVQRIVNHNIVGLLLTYGDKIRDRHIPSLTTEKIALLHEVGALSAEEAQKLLNFHALVYRLRFRSDVISTKDNTSAPAKAPMGDRHGDFVESAVAHKKLDPLMMTSKEREDFARSAKWFNQLFEQKIHVPIPKRTETGTAGIW